MTPTAPVAAAVVSEDSVAPMKTPCCQARASPAGGMVSRRRPPKKIASSGTPLGSSHSGATVGHWLSGVVKRLFG